MRHHLLSLAVLLACSTALHAQRLPLEIHRSADGRTLLTGDQPNSGLYDQSQIRSIYLTFAQPNYWQLLQANNAAEIDIPATMVVDGVTYDSVGVRFRGNTSFTGTRNSEKKSFNISVDFVHEDQRVMGYKTLNLLNCYEDPSFIREVFYQHQIRRHVPAAKSAFTRLYINGQYWGLYPNVQQLNKDYYKEWFLSNDGTNWRADAPSGSTGGGPGGGPQWGDGTAALNYLGEDTALYQRYYTLKSSEKDQPWGDLVATCAALNNTPIAELPSVIPTYLDVDRTLWFLASEILYADDDSYANKGKMDYYLYWEAETGRITPQEFDGNSVMDAKNQNWGAFYHETDTHYPLLNRLLAVPAYRQRYLAHLRTLIAEQFDNTVANGLIDRYVAMIDTIVQNDPKKLYTYSRFTSEIAVLRNFISGRRTLLLANAEVAQTAPAISGTRYSSNGTPWAAPAAGIDVTVLSSATHTGGLAGMNLYYSDQLVGNFTKVVMADDGLHGDGAAGDGTYGAVIPGRNAGTLVRFYIEAVAGNSAKSVRYDPVGAEHDVYTYTVAASAATADTSIAINEVMASNAATMTDNAGEYEDWIELYNKTAQPVDLSGYHLTDDPTNPTKWTFPAGSIVPAGGYYIVWADEDEDQGDNHASFKLSASGEQVLLLDTSLGVVDSAGWGAQTADMGYARVPNGYGSFVVQGPTFNASNETTAPPVAKKDVAINEVMASNTATATDDAGEYEDWIELYNKTAQPVDLSGYHLTDDPTNPTKWTFPAGSIIPAGDYYIVWADDNTAQGNNHASFKLSASGEQVLLFDTALALVDSAGWGAQSDDMGYARVPNGTGGFVVQEPTFNASNVPPVEVPHLVAINELMASNAETMTDNAGEYEDWIELYNKTGETVDLSGYHLTDDPTNLTKWTLPQGTVLLGGGYFIIWADEDEDQGSNHCNFKLSASAEQLLLLDASLNLIDSVSWGAQTTDRSYARVPNGVGNFVIQGPTFNASNETVVAGAGNAQSRDGVMVLAPNPAHGQVRVTMQTTEPQQIVVMNALGQEVYNGTVEQSVTLDLAGWAAGLYIVRCGSRVAQLVVQP